VEGVLWSVIIAASLFWNIAQIKKNTHKIALAEVDLSSKKDILYRHWNAGHSGVYVPVTEDTQPNPYLSHLPDRDLTTTTGKHLTLVNPAYMTRQVNELAKKESLSILTRITSLKPLNPGNAPDAWERNALTAFERKAQEVTAVEDIEGRKHMRLIRPFFTEKKCLKCHALQGYREGEIRGGISVTFPIDHLITIQNSRINWMIFIHVFLWILGIGGITFSAHRLGKEEQIRSRMEQEREKIIVELQQSLDNIKQLQGILPICSGCKKIRDDQGYWHQVEVYISHHTEADFSHGLCEECAHKLYPELYKI
jgi:hypothetical protein